MRLFRFLISATIIAFMMSCNSNKEEKQKTGPQEVVKVKSDIDKIEPPHWWTGFKNEKLQLLVKHPNIGSATPEISYSGVALEKVHKADSPNYLFLDLSISDEAEAGKFNIKFKLEDGSELFQTYELKERKKPSDEYVGFNSSDAIYLITPDRFANGDLSNDAFDNLNEKTINRSEDYARHGGDIAGITNNLDYIDNMGFTAIWPGPLLINDMATGSYHGYAMTDFYKVDPRFGTLEEYKKLAQEMQNRDMKLIMDQVANHSGLEHWWMKDLPFKDWVNFQEHYENNKTDWNWETVKTSNHKRTVNQDLYASAEDKKNLSDGWFVDSMPDLNQRNPYMANYIIQNSIWWIETLQLGGIRQDTYPYPDKDFMNDWTGAIMEEYPNFNIVGEEWSYNPALVAYWQKGHKNSDGYESNLRSTMDFPMQGLIIEGLKEKDSWDKGLIKIYEGLANDFVYANPQDLMVFPDNHDMSRIFTQLDGNLTNTKMALSYLLVLPRIPQIYYGTEILMDDFEKPGDHGLIRTDFPGGWEGDAVNAFTGEGLTEDQKEMQPFLKKLLNYRKDSKAIHSGKTIHFGPENGVYLLARQNENETVVHIINKNEEPYELNLERFEELGLNGKTVKNIITGKTFTWDENLIFDEAGSTILTTKTDD
ncbi:glycoside hydrolase family 13 protein [Winogradskyella ursingii]|uniref:glycoside hydrolase family 13 protein n=1 Tax=Winogradskyella ursingii TaxID=2686079 RepID=UPI0015C7B5E4|nr:glycoside hydrolase family 13 protein [Winogradskyella ursingii]